MGRGVFELGNPEWRGLEQVWKSSWMGAGGGQKTVPSVMGVWIFSGITHFSEITALQYREKC